MSFTADFVAVSNAPAANIPSGYGIYARSYEVYAYVTNGGYYVSETITNEFGLAIDVGTNANTEAWIVQLEDDATLTPVKYLGGPTYGLILPFYFGPVRGPAYNYSNMFQLTAEQSRD